MSVVSIIVPCYNHGSFLAESLESIRAQTWPAWECIVVDDGSTDASFEVATRFQAADSRVRVIRQANQGMSSARNAGLRDCQGEYVFFLDADDLIHREALAWLTSAARGEKRLALMGSCSFTTHPDADAYARQMPRATVQMLPDLLRDNLAPIHCFLSRRSDVVEAHGFDEALYGCEDWALWLRLALLGVEAEVVPRIGAYYRKQTRSMSTDTVRMLSGAIAVQLSGYAALVRGDGCVDSCERPHLLKTAAAAMRLNVICLSGALFRHGERQLASHFLRLEGDLNRLLGRRTTPGLAALHARYRCWRYPVRQTTPMVLDGTRKLLAELRAALKES
ncbi:MAG TPA: glycosyltransferase family A protein [Pirellulales bacterium]|nr:glycosyltransferase family A protein [Pirellulales bacterium]